MFLNHSKSKNLLIEHVSVSIQVPIGTSSKERYSDDINCEEGGVIISLFMTFISSKCHYGVVKINDTLMRQ